MNKYRVYVEKVVFYSIDVEAENREDAVDEALTEGLPGLMFLNHEYPDEGEWYVSSTDDFGDQVELLEGEEP